MESLIRGKSREEKTNNQFEPPVRFNGTYTQVWGAVFVHKSTGAVGNCEFVSGEVLMAQTRALPHHKVPKPPNSAPKFAEQICGHF